MRGDPKVESDGLADTKGESPSRARYVFANVEFDEWLGRLRVDGEAVEVEPRPLRLLAELLRRVNEVLSKEELLDAVWQGRPTVDHVLANAISKLRSALGAAGAARLATLPRIGYRFSGPVQRLPGGGVDSTFAPGQTLVGRDGFVLDRQLGPGGNSDVWLARHAKLGQSHVFKLATDGPRLAALKREFTLYRVVSQALGQRTDFARILDANFQAPPFFLECEYGGCNLLEWADDDGNTLLELSLQERLDIFLQVAGSVAAAHSVGVLHKDLKPSNVLINGQRGAWVVKLTDFGSGHLLEPERLAELRLTALGLTQAADASASDGRSSSGGTLMYMAPELLAGQAPTMQSDVYSLGVMLFQLVAGDLRRPLLTGWQREVTDELLRLDITDATESDLQRRLSSVPALVDRLTGLGSRHQQLRKQADAVAQAAKASASLQRVRARRPWLLAAVGSLVVGLLVSLWSYLQSQVSLQEAQAQAKRAQAINDFLERDVLVASQFGRSRSGAAVTLTDVLQRASERASERFQGQPDQEAALRLHLAQSMASMDNYYAAATEYQRALTLWAALRPPADPLRLQAQLGLSGILAVLSRKDEAKALLDGALQLASPTLRAATPKIDFAAERASYMTAKESASFQQALVHATRMREIADAAPSFDLTDRLNSRLAQAEMHYQLNDLPAAGSIVDELSAPPFGAESVGPVMQARTLVFRARQEASAGRLPAAEAILRTALTQLIENVGPADYYVGRVSAELSEIYAIGGRSAEAAQLLTQTMVAFKSSLGLDHPNVHITAVNKSFIDIGSNRFAEALQALDAERPWFAARPGDSARMLLQAIDFRRAIALTGLGRPAEALVILDKIEVSSLTQASWGDDWQHKLRAERGRALIAAGRRSEGLKELGDAVRAMRTECYFRAACDGYEQVLVAARRGKP